MLILETNCIGEMPRAGTAAIEFTKLSINYSRSGVECGPIPATEKASWGAIKTLANKQTIPVKND